MGHNPHSSRVRTFFGSKIFLGCAFLLTFAFALGFARAYFKDYAFREEVKRLQGEIGQLEKKKLESIELLRYISSTVYLEDTARLDLNLKKTGEHVLFVDMAEKKEESFNTEGKEAGGGRQDISNPLKWWYYFIHTVSDSGP